MNAYLKLHDKILMNTFLFVLKEEVGGTTYRIGTPAQGVRGEGWLRKETDR